MKSMKFRGNRQNTNIMTTRPILRATICIHKGGTTFSENPQYMRAVQLVTQTKVNKYSPGCPEEKLTLRGDDIIATHSQNAIATKRKVRQKLKLIATWHFYRLRSERSILNT